MIAIGLGFYALHLKRKVARDAQTAAEQQLAMAAPGNGRSRAGDLYVANDSDGTLRKTQITVPLAGGAQRARARRVASPAGTVPEIAIAPSHRCRRRMCANVYLMGDDTAIVDTNSAFADAHPSGVLAEELTVASIVVTLNANDSKIGRVKILVNGQERDTLAGHADLRRFYEAGNIGQVVKDMQ